ARLDVPGFRRIVRVRVNRDKAAASAKGECDLRQPRAQADDALRRRGKDRGGAAVVGNRERKFAGLLTCPHWDERLRQDQQQTAQSGESDPAREPGHWGPPRVELATRTPMRGGAGCPAPLARRCVVRATAGILAWRSQKEWIG